MELAPIILFVYNRPWHTEQTLLALEKNELAQDSILYVYADGAKENASEEQLQKVQEVKTVINKGWKFKEINIIERDKNWGLAKNVIDGVTEIVNKYSKVIVLEDDLVTSVGFLKYMNDGLSLYENSSNVYSINGFMFDLAEDESSTTFLSSLATSSWGWATWSDRWCAFTEDIKQKEVLQNSIFLKNRFNFGGINYSDMLNNSNSWAIRWYYSVFLKNGLGLFPTKSFVKNIGFDGSGVHYTVNVEKSYNQILNQQTCKFSKEENINLLMEEKLRTFLSVKSTKKTDLTLLLKFKNRIKRIMK